MRSTTSGPASARSPTCRLPLRYLKIDRSFVIDLPRSADDQRGVQSIIGIADSFGLQVIAEGVEAAETLELLRDLGGHYAQGFHIGYPGPLMVEAGPPARPGGGPGEAGGDGA